MKSVQENRFENFELLIREAGGVSKLARRCGYDKAAYLYQVRAKTVKPNGKQLQIGDRMAAKLEKGMNKPAGWMDVDHNGNPLDMAPGKKQITISAVSASNGNDQGNIQTITLTLTGASGMPYGIRLLEVLLQAGKNVQVIFSHTAQIVAQQEMNLKLPSSAEEAEKMLCEKFNVSPSQLRVFGREEWFAAPASGSSVADAVVVCPASMGTVAAIANGLSDNLIERAADVAIKERRPVIIVPRETPLSSIHLENLLKLSKVGCTILPPAAGFYTKPQSIDDMVDFVVSRILDQLRIPHNMMPQWGK